MIAEASRRHVRVPRPRVAGESVRPHPDRSVHATASRTLDETLRTPGADDRVSGRFPFETAVSSASDLRPLLPGAECIQGAPMALQPTVDDRANLILVRADMSARLDRLSVFGDTLADAVVQALMGDTLISPPPDQAAWPEDWLRIPMQRAHWQHAMDAARAWRVAREGDT
jgi:hypothetical protein